MSSWRFGEAQDGEAADLRTLYPLRRCSCAILSSARPVHFITNRLLDLSSPRPRPRKKPFLSQINQIPLLVRPVAQRSPIAARREPSRSSRNGGRIKGLSTGSRVR